MRWFFASVFAFAVPFWVLGAIVESPSWAPMGLPTSGLMFVVPGVVALVLAPRIVGTLRWRLPARRWWVLIPALLLAPLLLLVTELLVAPDAGVLPIAALPALVLAFLVAAAFEKLGWTAYATERMLGRHGELTTALIVGVAWAAWHVVPLVQAGHGPGWITGWAVGTIALRIVICRLYVLSGRVAWIAAVCHASINVAEALVPNLDATPVLVVDGLLTAAVAIAMTILARRRGLNRLQDDVGRPQP